MGRRKKTRVISARLSEDRPHDRIAMSHIEAAVAKGLPLQGVIVDAICKAAGTDVTYYDKDRVTPQSSYVISALIERMDAMQDALLEGFAQLLMDELKRMNVISADKHTELTMPSKAGQSSFIRSLASSYAKRQGDE